MYTITNPQLPFYIIRINKLIELTCLSRSTIWRRVHAGEFPRPLKLGGRSIGWKSTDVIEYLEALPRA